MGFFDNKKSDRLSDLSIDLYNEGKISEAVEACEQSLKYDPNNDRAWFNLGFALIKLNLNQKGLDALNKAISIKPNFVKSWYWKGVAHYNLRDFEDAIKSFKKSLSIDSNYKTESLQKYLHDIAVVQEASAWFKRANELRDLNQYDEAIRAYEQAIERDPSNTQAIENRQTLLKFIQSINQCTTLFAKAESFGPVPENISKNFRELSKEQLINTISDLNRFIQESEEIKNIRESARGLFEKAEAYGKIPDSIPRNIDKLDKQPLERTISELEKFLKTEKPYLTFSMGTTQFIVNQWHKTKISITNEGSAHAKDVTFKFSDDVDVRRINTMDVLAIETKQIEVPIKAKVKGTIPLDIIVTYCDSRGKLYSDTFDFDIEVIETGTIAPPPVDTPKLVPQNQPLIVRAYEFYAGYIRLKISVKNPTPLTIHDVILEPDVDRAILYLDRHEPEEYPSENERIILGTINPSNDRTVSLYLEPTICAKEGTDVQCHVRYKDAQGKPGSLDMEPLRIQVICPIFDTKEPVNIGSLKQLIETLPSRDTKIFSVPRNLDAPTQLKLFQSVIQLHDIRHISTLRRANNFESWYYGRTKVSQKDMVIKLGIAKDMDMVEITAFSYDPKDLTGLLAEINRHVTEEVSKRGNVQKIFNISIKDSVVQRTNLMSFCDADGKCSGNVTITDSVIIRSNIL